MTEVRAIKRGEYGDLREEGDVFDVKLDRHLSAEWMERTDGKPIPQKGSEPAATKKDDDSLKNDESQSDDGSAGKEAEAEAKAKAEAEEKEKSDAAEAEAKAKAEAEKDNELDDDVAVAINAALDKLDHNNNDHWIQSGQPKMSVVEDLVGGREITRADVEAVRPGFLRTAS